MYRSQTIKITIEGETEQLLRILYQQLGHDMQGWDDEQIAETLVESLSGECRAKFKICDLPVRAPFKLSDVAHWLDHNTMDAIELAKKVI